MSEETDTTPAPAPSAPAPAVAVIDPAFEVSVEPAVKEMLLPLPEPESLPESLSDEELESSAAKRPRVA